MEPTPIADPDFGSIPYLKEQLKLYRECSADNEFLKANQHLLQKVLLRGLNTDATFHEAVETLLAVTSFIHKQDDQTQWQRITWDALVGALNLRDSGLQAQILPTFSRFHLLEGKHQLARKTIENARDRALEMNNDAALLEAYIRLFELLFFQPTEISRHEVVEQVLQLAKKVNQIHLTIQLHYALAHFNNRWGDWERALGHGQFAYALARHNGDREYLARTAYLLVSICWLSSCPAAKHFLRVALTIDTSPLPIHDQVTALMHTGGLYYEMGNVAEAASGFAAAIKLLEPLNRPNYLAAAYQGLALAQIRLKQFDEAESNLLHAQKIWKKHGSALDIANLRFTQGFLEAWRGKQAFALEYLDEALALCSDIPDMASRDALRKLILETQQQIVDGTLGDSYRLA